MGRGGGGGEAAIKWWSRVVLARVGKVFTACRSSITQPLFFAICLDVFEENGRLLTLRLPGSHNNALVGYFVRPSVPNDTKRMND